MGSAKEVGKLNQKMMSEAKGKLKNALGKAKQFGSNVSREVRQMRNSARAFCRKEVAKIYTPRYAVAGGIPVDARTLAEEFGRENRVVRKISKAKMKVVDSAKKSRWNSINGNQVAQSAKDFEECVSKLPLQERIAAIKEKAREVAIKKGLVKDSKLSKTNGHDIYKDLKSSEYYSLDTRHGRFEHLNKRGKHLGEVNFDFEPTKGADLAGGHDIKI